MYALYHLNEPRFNFFDSYIPNWNNLRVLDVGCGGGFSCEYIANRGAIVSGIDQSAKCIEQACIHAVKNRLNIDYQYGYAEAIPFQDSTFDVVVCVDVLEHVADLVKTILEISRVLKPGGLFFSTLLIEQSNLKL